nr:insulin-like growth factor-binding protein 1 [Nothobranchius furzeri]
MDGPITAHRIITPSFQKSFITPMRQTRTEHSAINTAARGAQLVILAKSKERRNRARTEGDRRFHLWPTSSALLLCTSLPPSSTQIMLAMRGLPLRQVAVAAVCFALVAVTLGSPVVGPEPFRCAPCTPERLSQCPVVAPGCAEVLREPGCGCCLACALKAGELCGIYTAPCGSGLRCTPRPDDPRPLHSLTRGQAVCTESAAPQPTPEPQTQDLAEPEPELDNSATSSDPGSSPYLPGLGKPYDVQESMKAKLIAIRRKLVEQGPCHLELQTALDRISKAHEKLGEKLTRFYLPNCDKHGLYKQKQCESTLDGQKGRCWCVSSWNGKKLLGSSDLPSEADCR